MSDQMKNMMIGIFVIAAFSIIVFMLMFLHPYIGDEGQILRVRFTDIDKVSVGTRVLFAGKPIGEVVNIKEIEEARLQRKERKGDIYVYELELAVDSDVRIYNTDKISLRTSGLLGEKSVSIDPEPPEPGQTLRQVNGEIIYAEQVGSVEDTFAEFKQVADRVDQALDQVSEALTELKEGDFWENLAGTVAATREVAENIQKGEGTLGRLLNDEDMYLKTSSVMSKAETIMDDVNHYGILFHNDKGWQRLRARRLNLLQKLSTPQEFRNYFNDEINQINTSLSRVGMVLDKTECYPCLMDDKEFSKVYAELLRRVVDLEEALQMYNMQVVECEVEKTELAECR